MREKKREEKKMDLHRNLTTLTCYLIKKPMLRRFQRLQGRLSMDPERSYSRHHIMVATHASICVKHVIQPSTSIPSLEKKG
jgi:hypothetical protein